jgi:hypothetical protein
MKKTVKLFGIIALAAMFLAGCEGGTTEGGKKGSSNQTPKANDYYYSNFNQIVGSTGRVIAVIITPKAGRSSGARTIYYNGSTTLPTTLGNYAVTFDVEAAKGWDAKTGLSAGNLNLLDIDGELARRDVPNVLDQDGSWSNKRRAEVLDIMLENVYGVRVPAPESMDYLTDPLDVSIPPWFTSANHTFERVKITCNLSADNFPGVNIFTDADGKFEFYVRCHIPSGASSSNKVPAVIAIEYRESNFGTNNNRNNNIQQMTNRGVAAFTYSVYSIVNDYNDGGGNGQYNIAGIDRMYYGDYRLAFEGSKQEVTNVPRPDGMPATGVASTREGNDPGTMAFWAWAASRVMDYLETLDNIDQGKVAVTGHSRLGSTAMLAGALDERFAYVRASGGDAALARGNPKGGNPIPNHVNSLYIQWYCRNLLTQNVRSPHDGHFLLACVAPRKLYVTTAINDQYVDAPSEYLSYIAAGEVWKAMAHKGFIAVDGVPAIGDKFHEGDIGYDLRDGGHSFSEADVAMFLDFFLKE